MVVNAVSRPELGEALLNEPSAHALQLSRLKESSRHFKEKGMLESLLYYTLLFILFPLKYQYDSK